MTHKRLAQARTVVLTLPTWLLLTSGARRLLDSCLGDGADHYVGQTFLPISFFLGSALGLALLAFVFLCLLPVGCSLADVSFSRIPQGGSLKLEGASGYLFSIAATDPWWLRWMLSAPPLAVVVWCITGIAMAFWLLPPHARNAQVIAFIQIQDSLAVLSALLWVPVSRLLWRDRQHRSRQPLSLARDGSRSL